ncbi:hypothetical protein D3C84_1154840 [compost metagenome]
MLIEQTNHRQRQGIEPCRPIQRQVPDAVAHLGYDRQIVLAHDQLSCLRYRLMMAEKSSCPWPRLLKV